MKKRTASYSALLFCAANLCSFAPAAWSTSHGTTQQSPTARLADFRGQSASRDAQHIADWATHTRDSRGLPFIVIDKVEAKAYAFNASGALMRSAPVLLGMGVGDMFPPGVADMDMYATKPWQRVTPAGRFHAHIDPKGSGNIRSLLWIDYDTGIALHKIPAGKSSQRRHERIKSSNVAQKRMTFGCINVPTAFYDQVVLPAFKGKGGIVYVLPETAPAAKVFGSYDVRDGNAARGARQRDTTAHLPSSSGVAS
jgi:hypothetical protein